VRFSVYRISAINRASKFDCDVCPLKPQCDEIVFGVSEECGPLCAPVHWAAGSDGENELRDHVAGGAQDEFVLAAIARICDGSHR